MSKAYLKKYISKEGLDQIAEGDLVVFDMPGFCSGNYQAKVKKDEDGVLYINKKNCFFNGARDYYIWRGENRITLQSNITI